MPSLLLKNKSSLYPHSDYHLTHYTYHSNYRNNILNSPFKGFRDHNGCMCTRGYWLYSTMVQKLEYREFLFRVVGGRFTVQEGAIVYGYQGYVTVVTGLMRLSGMSCKHNLTTFTLYNILKGNI